MCFIQTLNVEPQRIAAHSDRVFASTNAVLPLLREDGISGDVTDQLQSLAGERKR
jgi:hypothetical protein